MKIISNIFFVGNLESILFKQRIEMIVKSADLINYTIIDTSRKSIQKIFKYFFKSIILFFCGLVSFKKITLIFHGAYSPVLWFVVLLPRVKVISILQGSELEIDYFGVRSFLIKLILIRSDLIIGRNESQLIKVRQLTLVKKKLCKVINWGLSNEIFSITKNNNKKYINIISPRASQPEYNIPIIFQVIKKLKNEGFFIKFCYVEFNKTIDHLDEAIIDKKLINLSQKDLWQEIANSDLLISIPNYDGLSNTVIESIGLGTYNICSALETYNFFKKETAIGVLLKLGEANSKIKQNLYDEIKRIIPKINIIREDSFKRKRFAMKNLSKEKGLDLLIDLIHL